MRGLSEACLPVIGDFPNLYNEKKELALGNIIVHCTIKD